MRSPSLSVSGRSRRWKLLTLACTQPARSVTRARAGPARLRRPVASRDQLLGLGGGLVEVGLERVRQVGRGERLPPGGPDRDPLGELPVDRAVAHAISRRGRTGGTASCAGRRR